MNLTRFFLIPLFDFPECVDLGAICPCGKTERFYLHLNALVLVHMQCWWSVLYFWSISMKWYLKFQKNSLKCTELIINLTFWVFNSAILFRWDKSKMLNETYFHESRLSDNRFAEWIASSNSKENAYYKLCKCVISLSNMGEKALHSPADGKKHKERLDDHEQVKNFFKLKSATDITKETNKTSEHVTIITPVNSVLDAGSTSSNASHAKLLDACFQHWALQKAEIMWAWKNIYNGLSDSSSKNVVGLSKTLFPDSEIAEKIQLEPRRLKYAVNHGIAPYVKKNLKNNVIGTVEFPGLIDFGSYNLHIVHGAFNSSAETSGWNLKKLLKSCFQHLIKRCTS